MNSEYTRNWPNVKYYRIFVIYLTLFMFLLPFIWWPRASIAYELPRVWYVLIGIDMIVLVASGVVHTIVPKLSVIPHLKIMGLFLGIAVISGVTGTDVSKSIFGNPWRLDGIITLVHLSCFAVLVASLKDTAKQAIVRATGISAFILSLLVSGEWALYLLGFPIPTVGGTIGSTFGQPNFLAGFLVVSLPFVWYTLQHFMTPRFHTTRIAIFMTVPIMAIMATGAKGGIAGILLFGMLLIANRPEFIKIVYKKVIIGIGMIGIIALIWYSFWSASQIPQQVLAESRQRIMMKGLIAFTHRPLLGWGWANYDHAFASVDWPYHFQFDAYVDKAHSSVLEVLVTTGIIGFTVYVLFLYLLYRALSKPEKNPTDALFSNTLLWSFLLYLFHSQTNVTSIAEEVLFWLIVGCSVKLFTKTQS